MSVWLSEEDFLFEIIVLFWKIKCLQPFYLRYFKNENEFLDVIFSSGKLKSFRHSVILFYDICTYAFIKELITFGIN